MSYLKIVPDLFIGSTELNRFQKFLGDDGFRRLNLKNSISFGLFHNNIFDGNWSNFLIKQGTNPGTIANEEGFAVDSNGQFIYRADANNILLTDDNLYYWIKIAHQYDVRETGLVSIAANGNMSGVGTEFFSVLRGLPNNSVKVSFPDAAVNTQEYQVVEVISDTEAVLAGNFNAESNLRYAVVGAYTPDVVVPVENRYPFQYSGCLMTLVEEAVLNTPPTLVTGEEFLIARVKRNGSSVIIEDKRSLNVYRSKDGFQLGTVDTTINPLFGVDGIQWDDQSSTRVDNLVNISWGFKASSWTIDSSANRVTLIAGEGGKFKTTTDFTDGDFDGWRLYVKSGKYYIIKQSTITATQISCILDSLDPDEFVDTTQIIDVVPNVEGIEITFTASSTTIPGKTVYYPIRRAEAKVPVMAYQASATYSVTYRYKNFWIYSQSFIIGEDTVGYYTEASYLETGALKPLIDRIQFSYNNTITLIQATNAYESRIASVETGDLLGVEYVAIDTATDPVIVFQVGARRKYVVITNDDDLDQSDADFGAQYSLTADSFLDLRTNASFALRNGNSFKIQFRGDYNLNGFNIRIVQDFVNAGNPGIILYTLNSDDIEQAAIDNLIFYATYDGSRWFLQKIKVPEIDAIGNRTYVSTNLISSGESITQSLQKLDSAFGDLNTVIDNLNTFTNPGQYAVPPGTPGTYPGVVDISGTKTLLSVYKLNYITGGITPHIDIIQVMEAPSFHGAVWSRSQTDGAGYGAWTLQRPGIKRVDIGDWDMNATSAVSPVHGLSDHTTIKRVSVVIRGDNDVDRYPLDRADSPSGGGGVSGGVYQIGSTFIALTRTTGGFFNSTSFDSTSYNRGFITIEYEP